MAEAKLKTWFLLPFQVEQMKVDNQMLQSVAYLASRDADSRYHFAGSVFFLGREKSGSPQVSDRVFAITALHVIEGLQRKNHETVYIRVNLRGGGVDWVETKTSDWHFVAGGTTDIAVYERGIPHSHDHLVIPYSFCATVNSLVEDGIGVGDEVFIVGLYARQPGKDRNIPIVRIGNIASLMPQLIKTTQFGDILGMLVEVKSLSGLSGSPVFVQYGYWRHKDGQIRQHVGYASKLIGMVHGHHEVSVATAPAHDSDRAELDKLNTGIAIVVPFEEIEKVIQDYNLKANGEPLVWR